MRSSEFREIQVSSTQLAVIFLGILVIGVVIFLLGVSVGKKHAQAALKANVIAQKVPEQAKEKFVTLPQLKTAQEPAAEAAEKPAPTQTESVPAKTGLIPQKSAEKPKVETQLAGSKAQVQVDQPASGEKTNLFYVQVGALAERQGAQATAERYRKMGYPVVVLEPQATDKRPVFRVRVGGFQTREQAEQARARLSAAAGRQTDFFIVRY